MRIRMIAAMTALLALAPSLTTAGPVDPLTEAEATRLAAEAYVYGFPLVLMDASRRVMTAVAKPGPTAAPLGRFNDSTAFPDATFTSVVSPNADTLYSFAWLELGLDPVVLSVPDTGDRYYLLQMLDAWTDVFASPGTRTTGNRPHDFALVGPNYVGKVPAGLEVIRSPTSLVWILGRTQTNGPADYAAVRALKARYTLTPLAAWGKASTPPGDEPIDPGVDAKTPPVDQVAALDGATFFGRLAILLESNPPAVADRPMVASLARLGIVPGRPFAPETLAAPTLAGLRRGAELGLASIRAEAKTTQGKRVNGWDVIANLGRYGTDYRFRAVVALIGLGANLPEDAVYPMTSVDSDGAPLTGSNRYEIRFPKGELPPVRAFWSITMYNAHQFFVPNPLDRFALGDRDPLTFAPDGSLTLYLQHDSPGKAKESNWLPAPEGSFNLFLRMYWPKPAILDGSWKPPAVRKVAG